MTRETNGSKEDSWPYQVEMKNGDSVMSLDAPPRRLAMRECKQVYDAKADRHMRRRRTQQPSLETSDER